MGKPSPSAAHTEGERVRVAISRRGRGSHRLPAATSQRRGCRAVRYPHPARARALDRGRDRKSTRLNSSHQIISYAVFCLKKKKQISRKSAKRTLLYNHVSGAHQSTQLLT